MKPLLLILCPLSKLHRDQIGQHYEIIYSPETKTQDAQLAVCNPAVRVVLTTGVIGLCAAAIDVLPQLELVCTLGVGYENVALEHARERGIALANGAGTNSDCVADHAMGLLLATVRNIVQLDASVRQGIWRDALPWPSNVSEKRLGLLGLGDIGMKIARRAQAFDMTIGYHSRRPRADVDYLYHPDVVALAQWCDFLVVATPGGVETFHLVNAQVLDALGPHGFLVNIARGSIVDTEAVAEALRDGRIAGAGLDVYESEPHAPQSLIGLDKVVLTPHLAGWSPEAVQKTVDHFLANASGHFSGVGPVSPI